VLDDDGDQIMLTVRDNGVGLAAGTQVLETNSCHGLRLLRERARFLGGSLVLAGLEGGGTVLRLTLPRQVPAN
jgi:signal transduction histidine kinase